MDYVYKARRPGGENHSELDEREVYHMLWSAQSVPVDPTKWTEREARGLLFSNIEHYAQSVMRDKLVQSGLYVPMIIGMKHCLIFN